jgi:hypothetical protein
VNERRQICRNWRIWADSGKIDLRPSRPRQEFLEQAMAGKKIKINRAPVLTLWAAIVAQRLGYDEAAALTLGKAVAGLNAQSKGKRLGIFTDSERNTQERPAEGQPHERPETVNVLGRPVPISHTDEGIRAVSKEKPISPASVRRYLAARFGADLDEVKAAMQTLANALPPKRLANRAYALYEEFRPAIPEGQKGWGAAGELDLDRLRALADRRE